MFGIKDTVTEKMDIVRPVVRSLVVFILSVILLRLLYYFYTHPFLFSPSRPGSLGLTKENIFIAALEIALVAAGVIIIKFFRMHRLLLQKEKDLVWEKQASEIQFLRHQINPHFLFNTLNNIYALARRKSDDTAEVVIKLSKLLRFMLYESKSGRVKISDEIKMLEDYIELEKIRYPGQLAFSFLREVDNENEELAPLLLINFVENAFKYGAGQNCTEAFIHMELKLQNNQVNFQIENTQEEVSTHKGIRENIGLSNVRRQLELLYPDHRMIMKNEERNFKVHLEINLNSYAGI
jgi:two-component system, LytTR family, sensor kinase